MKRFKKTVAVMLALMFMLSVECACLNPVSVDSCGYVVAIGADEGEEKAYEITLELQRASSGTDTENNGGAILLCCEADDLFDAINELARGIAYQLNFTRTHVFVFGESLAKNGKIPDFLKLAFDILRIRKSALMVVSKSPVKEYIGGLAANNAANIAKMQDALIADAEKTGQLAALNVSLFYEAVSTQRFDPVMALGQFDEKIITDTKQHDLASKGENPIKDAKKGERVGGMQSLTYGAALFDGAKMVGELNAHETKLMNMVRGDYKEGSIMLQIDDESPVSLLTVLDKRNIKVRLTNSGAMAKVKIRFYVSVERDEKKRIGEDGSLEKYAAVLEKELRGVFEKARALGSDAMGFGKYASMNFFSTKEYEAFDWKEEYTSLQADFSVTLVLNDEYLAKLNR